MRAERNVTWITSQGEWNRITLTGVDKAVFKAMSMKFQCSRLSAPSVPLMA
jgi:hypothetical protein